MLEDALALQKVVFADGIDGGETGWWHPSTFERSDLQASVLKLHGSINWCELVDDPLPRRIPPRLEMGTRDGSRVLIWPATTKYRETQRDPFAQLLTRARRILRPTTHSQLVMAICGYSFGDSHINLEIDHALRDSGGRLTVAVFSSDAQPAGQLKEWYDSPAVQDQVLIFARRGFFHANTSVSSSEDLPWWKFENLVRLLEGER